MKNLYLKFLLLIAFTAPLFTQDRYASKVYNPDDVRIDILSKMTVEPYYIDAIPDDPRVKFATFYGGAGYDECSDMEVDSKGNIIQVGYTGSPDLPMVGNGFSHEKSGSYDMFVVKWDTTGQPIWSTFFGGTNEDVAYDVEIDSDDNIIFVGRTMSEDIPIVGNIPYQDTLSGDKGQNDAFIVKMNSDGDVIWSTYYGGKHTERPTGIAVDDKGDIYIVGYTTSMWDLPTTENAFKKERLNTEDVSSDGFIAKFSSDGALLYSSYFGMLHPESIFDVEVYGDEVAICGIVQAGAEFTHYTYLGLKYVKGTEDAIQQLPCDTTWYEYANYQDPFLAKFNKETFELEYMTYYCINGEGAPNDTDEWLKGIEYDSKGNLYLVGTEGHKSILKKGSVLEDYSGGRPGHAYIMCLNHDDELSWDARVGGDRPEFAEEFYIDEKDVLWTSILTQSMNLPEDEKTLPYDDTKIILQFLYRLDIPKMKQWYTYHQYSHSLYGIVANQNVLSLSTNGTSKSLLKNAFQEEYLTGRNYLINFDFRDDFGWTSVEITEDISFNIYPNPTRELIHLQSNEYIKKIKLYDLFGKKVIDKRLSIPISEIEINLSNIPQGIYLLQINNQRQNLKKVVILR